MSRAVIVSSRARVERFFYRGPRLPDVRILIRPRLPVLALLLFAPTIPELLTGSTPVSELLYNPFGFLVGFSLDVALYGGGALLIREFVVRGSKGWGSILLLGAAYGIAEEGFEVHTFFQPSGSPVGALASYGHAFGVNWLWALGLATFHAVYSIALPILLTRLWFPEVASVPWLDRGSVVLVAALYLTEVVGFGFVVGHGPSVPVAALFGAIVAALLAAAYWLPRDALALRRSTTRWGRTGLVLFGTVLWDAWLLVLVFAGVGRPSAWVAAVVFVLINAGALGVLRSTVGTDDLERSEFYFATGMLGALAVWDVAIEFSVPGILVVALAMLYLQYRLGRRIASRARDVVPAGAATAPPNG